MIQPIDAVYFIKNQNVTDLFSVTVFSISTSNTDPKIMFGLLCVSNSD